MATINLAILNAAYEDRLIPKRLSSRQKLYLSSSILGCNEMYWLIADEAGIEQEQIAKRLDLYINTVRIYTRWMISKGILTYERDGTYYKLYTQKRCTTIKPK